MHLLPTMDLHDQADGLVVELRRPGIDTRDVEVCILKEHLIVTGRFEQTGEHPGGEQSYTERWVLRLPTDLNADESRASLKEGMLTVMLPKKKREPSIRTASYKDVQLERT